MIQCKNCEKIYVGSTLRRLSYRQAEHKSECFNSQRHSYNCKAYQHFRSCGMKKEDIECILIAETDSKTLRLEEAKYIKTYGQLNVKSSVFDEEKAKKRVLKSKTKGKKPKLCVCGRHWTYGHKNRHFCSTQHQNFLKNKKSYLEKNIFSTNDINDNLDRPCKKDGKEEQNIIQGSNECCQTNIQIKKIKFDKKSKIFVIEDKKQNTPG